MTAVPFQLNPSGRKSSIASTADSGESPPATAQAGKVEALVDEAAALIDNRGKAAFPELRKKDSEWFYGTTYLFVYDLKANVMLNAAFPMREGTNVAGEKDAEGKLFNAAMLNVAEIGRASCRERVFLSV